MQIIKYTHSVQCPAQNIFTRHMIVKYKQKKHIDRQTDQDQDSNKQKMKNYRHRYNFTFMKVL